MIGSILPACLRGGGRGARSLVAVLMASALVVGCGGGTGETTAVAKPGDNVDPVDTVTTSSPSDLHTASAEPAAKPIRLRAGERRTTLQMPASYSPAPPTEQGTDDYRCFLLDPNLPEDAWLTGTNILPGNPDVVHHVILFRIDDSLTEAAEAEDARSPQPGWTCFGAMGLEGEFDDLDDASWLGAWAPGGRETVVRDGYGVALDQGTKIVMQVHYSLLLHDEGDLSDVSATQIRWRPRAGSALQEVHTVLLPAPVELPCRPDYSSGALCTHDASVTDVVARFGERAGQTANLLHLLCGTEVRATETESCTRTVQRPMTILGAAGHMHLLGRWITIQANADTPRESELLNIPLWNFDDQAARPVEPLHLDAGDTLTVTCHHEQTLRDFLPAFEGTEEKYVVWGEGSADEMCLGILQAVFDE